jgi:hypothetical protein
MTETTSFKYYIGDLCYVMSDEWENVCEAFFVGDNDESIYELEDGRVFFMMNTAYGDGRYNDLMGHPYPVDSGTIGAIKVEDVRDPEFASAVERGLGHIHEFPYELTELDVENNDGVLCFGDVVIDTSGDGEPDEDPEAEDEYDDEEDA